MERFSVKQIEAIRECFVLHSPRSSTLSSAAQLRCILRSVGVPVKHADSVKYFEQKTSPLDVQAVLDIIAKESQASVNSMKEIRGALEAACPRGANAIDATTLARILSTTGEKLTPREIESLFSELSPTGAPISFNKLIAYVETKNRR